MFLQTGTSLGEALGTRLALIAFHVALTREQKDEIRERSSLLFGCWKGLFR